jgi:citrate lyase subunit alpha / citrate CoA-transferase
MILNAAGREIPEELNGRSLRPYQGAFAHIPDGKKTAPRLKHSKPGDSKILATIDEAIKRSGLSDGMTISFHHHLRYGDMVLNMVLERIASAGIKDLRLAQTALFGVHEPLIGHIRNGVITRIEGSINDIVGYETSKGVLKEPIVLRSHGGRVRAIEAGELTIDVAFIGASEADELGNCNGVNGPSAFGPMGYAYADAQYADTVVVITDNLVPFPVNPIRIPMSHVDYVVQVPNIGDPDRIAMGTLKMTDDPTRLKIARYVVEVLDACGYIRDGFSFQAGAGGISLAAVKFLGDLMKEKGVKGNFVMGGITGIVVDMLNEGTIRRILDTQSFDTAAVQSMRTNPDHVEVSIPFYANPHSMGCVVHQLDTAFLGATEVDEDFNVNVNTHSDGLLLHGVGGHMDVAAGSKLTIIPVPLTRKKFPVVRERVTTITSPGDTVDVVITDQGIAVNPRRPEIREMLDKAGLPVVNITELRKMAYEITGTPPEPEFEDRIIGIIEYRDGTVIDVVRKVKGYGD